jgi:hypothetical protein
MMLSGQVHLWHLLSPNQVYAKRTMTLAAMAEEYPLTYFHRRKGRSLFRRTLLLDRFQADEIIIEA